MSEFNDGYLLKIVERAQEIVNSIDIVAYPFLGGLARKAKLLLDGKLETGISKILSGLFISVTTGVAVHFLLLSVMPNIDSNLRIFLLIMSGACGIAIFTVLVDFTTKLINKLVKKKFGVKDEGDDI